MYPLVRSASGQATETKPYQESPQGFLRMADGFVDELERTRAAMRGLLHNITLLKTNPYGMEVMREIGDLSHPGYAPAKGGSEAPRWQVIARAVQAAEPFLQRIMIVRQAAEPFRSATDHDRAPSPVEGWRQRSPVAHAWAANPPRCSAEPRS